MREVPVIRLGSLLFLVLLLTVDSFSQVAPRTADATPRETARKTAPELELSRAVRPWEFISATGMHAALFGNEAGRFEAWVYPLKVLRDFHLRFHLRSLDIPAESLARTITVHPESTSILYASDTFTVLETLFVPVHESGAIIQFEISTSEPVEIEAEFERDFQLEWPGALSGVYSYWDPLIHGFIFQDELDKYRAIVGSPTAVLTSEEYWTNYAASRDNSFRLGVTEKGRETKRIVIAAAAAGDPSASADAQTTYSKLTTRASSLLREASDDYLQYLQRTIRLSIPDKQIQTAYEWSLVSMIQGLVDNPDLGIGLVAGYRTSGDSQRPGFAWFFGRDALWTSLAFDAAGDFTTTRAELDFLSRYQRGDGKIPHEVSQSASLVPWFKEYPYPYASADATPLFIIAMNDYVTQSGDVSYANQQWKSIWKAYEFLRSTFDDNGLAQNLGVGHGWVEGGPLLPVKTELYQGGLGLEATRALSHLAFIIGKTDLSDDLKRQFEQEQAFLNQAFWSKEKNAFAYALDKNNKQLDATSVLASVPMWFGLLDQAKVEATIDQLAGPDHQTDWGMRIISDRNPLYNPGGYHNGSVWPLFTGWAATGEYRYHRAFPAFSNLRANALLSMDGSLGHVTEVLSGDYNQPTLGASPQQLWSSAMVVNPLLRGLFGLEVDAPARRFIFAPHIPANWTSFQLANVHVGLVVLQMDYERTPDTISLSVRRTGSGECILEFSPALSLRARVRAVEVDGHPVAFRLQENSVDQHVTVSLSIVRERSDLRIHLQNDFGLSLTPVLPMLGESSQGLRISTESWSATRDQLTLQLSGIAGKQYDLEVWNPEQVASVEGAQLITEGNSLGRARLRFSGLDGPRTVVVHFHPRQIRAD